jgi:hypothetical protein
MSFGSGYIEWFTWPDPMKQCRVRQENSSLTSPITFQPRRAEASVTTKKSHPIGVGFKNSPDGHVLNQGQYETD